MSFGITDLFFILFIISVIIPMVQKKLLESRRLQLIHKIEGSRKSRLITLIHRQEALSFLGIAFARFIDIEDSEQIMRAIRLTDPDVPIDIVLHTPGGLVLASEQISWAIKRHPAKVTVFVPHYAMSGGTLIALGADEIIMDENAVLGPVDPQLGDTRGGSYPAASILAAMAVENPNRDDHTIILGDIAKKAINQVRDFIYALMKDTMDDDEALRLATTMSEGRWTHDYPINIAEAKELGLPARADLPKEFHQLMQLYPQAQQRRPSVEYVPVPYRTPPAPRDKDR